MQTRIGCFFIAIAFGLIYNNGIKKFYLVQRWDKGGSPSGL